MAKVSVVARIEAQPGKGDELETAARGMIGKVEAEAGTLVYALNRSQKEPDVLWFFELYSDGDALRAHGGSEEMKAFGAQIAHLVKPGTQIHVLNPVAAKGLAFD